MNITRDDVVELLKGAQVYDSRNLTDKMIESWMIAARIARWDLASAAFAIAEHYALSTERIMPGHVTALIRSRRRPGPPTVAELHAAPTGPTAGPVASTPEHRAAMRALVAEHIGRESPGPLREPWSDGPIEPRPADDVQAPGSVADIVASAVSKWGVARS